jgi:glutathione S-transferase
MSGGQGFAAGYNLWNRKPIRRKTSEVLHMSLTLYAHPFSSYCWKVLIALYENGTPFSFRVIEDAAGWAELESLWPIKKFPVLRDDEAVVAESSIIIEHLAQHHAGSIQLVPENRDAALNVRFLDRFFDNYVMAPMQLLVSNQMRAQDQRDAQSVSGAKHTLDVAYGWIDKRIAQHAWADGGHFTLADCSAAPALFYADWVHPISSQFPATRAYRARLLARASVARTVEEARPYRKFFPGGAPDRD